MADHSRARFEAAILIAEVRQNSGVESARTEDAIRAQYQAATDPMEKSVAALMLFYAGGSAIDMTETLRVLPIRPLKAVREHLQASVAVGHSV